MIRRIRRGRSPNCSATGSVVGLALVSATAFAAVVNAFADRFGRWTDGDDPEGSEPPRLREEEDGTAVLRWADPVALLSLDRRQAAAAVAAGAVVVGGSAPAVAGGQRAPDEVHVALTERCPASCTGCYLGADKEGADADEAALLSDLERLAAMGVFEVALGGGETGLDDRTLRVARHARALGMVPNLTTSGFGVTPEKARSAAEVFGQINISVDGLGEGYRAVRGFDGSRGALRVVRMLREAGARVGINTVLTRGNVEELPELAAVLQPLGIEDWQWLRFKPTGRGVGVYEAMRLTREQARGVFPLALQLEELGLTIRFDCALVPFLVEHEPPVERLVQLGISGCPGGQTLWSRNVDGRYAPCSFAEAGGRDWVDDDGLAAWRARAEAPPEPCASCTYRAVCRGGCRVVAAHAGDWRAADPECVRVTG